MAIVANCLVLFLLISTVTAKPLYNHIMMMMFENQGYKVTLANEYWAQIAAGGLLLTNLYAQTHPSQCNYVAQLGGSLFTCLGDSPYSTNATSLVDLMDSHGVTWKAYQEDYTPKTGGNCDTATSQKGLYYRKHNPFMSYSRITSNLTRCQNIVNADVFDTDVKQRKLPDFSYYTPNINNDAHDTDLDTSGQYLQAFLQQYLPYLNDTLLFITWDEDEGTEGNHIMGVLYGPGIKAGSKDDGTRYTQYSVGASVEQNWSLGNLGRNDSTANSWLKAIKTQIKREPEQEEY